MCKYSAFKRAPNSNCETREMRSVCFAYCVAFVTYCNLVVSLSHTHIIRVVEHTHILHSPGFTGSSKLFPKAHSWMFERLFYIVQYCPMMLTTGVTVSELIYFFRCFFLGCFHFPRPPPPLTMMGRSLNSQVFLVAVGRFPLVPLLVSICRRRLNLR